MYDGYRKRQLLLPSQRQRPYQRFFLTFQVQLFDQRGCFFFDMVITEAVYPAIKPDILHNGQVFIKRKLLAHVANILFYLFVLLINIKTCNGGLARSRQQQTAKHAHSGGFSCPVCSEETKYLTLLYIKIDLVDSRKVAETFCQIFCCYNFFL